MSAALIMTKQANQIDGSLKKKAYTFLEKLTTDPTAPGLHIEPIVGTVDPRVRTGRVDQQYRAVLFQLASGDRMSFVFHGIRNHDDAIKVAKQVKLDINSTNGLAEIRTVETAVDKTPVGEAPVDEAQPQVPVSQVAEERPKPASIKSPSSEPEISVNATWDDLVNVLGLPRAVADAAVMARTEEALLAAAHDGPEWQHLALLSLATGSTVKEVLEELHVDDDITPIEKPTDEQLLDRLKHPSSGIEFAEIDGVDELRRVIDEGDFGAWRVFLHPEQREFATRNRNGAFRLSGGAGTGKTVVLLHRAHRLFREHPGASIILTTFTVNLANSMQRDLLRLNPAITLADRIGQPGVEVRGIDSIASHIIRHSTPEQRSRATEEVLGTGRADVHEPTHDGQWRDAIALAGLDLPSEYQNESFFKDEYELVVLPNRIVDQRTYFRIPRPGRGARLSRGQRAQVWKVIDEYRRASELAGSTSFQEKAMIAATLLRHAAESGEHVANHVLVDEGQDMSPAHWHLVRALVPEGPDDLFIAEDSHQRIYGNKITLSHYGINIRGRSRRLTLNYRTTAQNLHMAVSILDGGDYEDLEAGEESTSGYRSARTGPAPSLASFDTVDAELDHAAQLLHRWTEETEQAESIAVLVRDKRQAKMVVAGLQERGMTAKLVDRKLPAPGAPLVMTMHRAKGMEFTKVLLFGISRGSVPISLRNYDYDESEAADALLRERSLLYVAASRARDELAITWNGERSKLLPDGS